MTAGIESPGLRRVDLRRDAPEAYRALAALTRAGAVEDRLGELVKVRVSQLNGCARCHDEHVRLARAAGEDERRLRALAAWRHADIFDARERAALALADALTLVAEAPPADEIRRAAARQFDDCQLAALVAAIIAINAWNRAILAGAPGPRTGAGRRAVG